MRRQCQINTLFQISLVLLKSRTTSKQRSTIDPVSYSTKMQDIHCRKKKCFRLTKICKKERKDHIFVSFLMFPLYRNFIFSELSFKRKCKKAASFRRADSCVNMKFSYTIVARFSMFYCKENKRFFTSV